VVVRGGPAASPGAEEALLMRTNHNSYDFCPHCDRTKDTRAKLCRDCFILLTRKPDLPPRGPCPKCGRTKDRRAWVCCHCRQLVFPTPTNGKYGPYRSITTGGYITRRPPGTQINLLEHRVVMQEKLGRSLRKGEVVHHINGNPSDNRPENLELFASNAEHLRVHRNARKENPRGAS